MTPTSLARGRAWAAEIALHASYVAAQMAAQTAAQQAVLAANADKLARLKGVPTRATGNKPRIAALFCDGRRWPFRDIVAAVPDLTPNQVKGALGVLMAEGALRSTHKGTQRTTYFNPSHKETS